MNKDFTLENMEKVTNTLWHLSNAGTGWALMIIISAILMFVFFFASMVFWMDWEIGASIIMFLIMLLLLIPFGFGIYHSMKVSKEIMQLENWLEACKIALGVS